MKTKKIQKKMSLNKLTIAELNVDEMSKQHGGATEETSPMFCTEYFCFTYDRPHSVCGISCILSC
ncbi:MAG: hypothetical protein GY940_17400 [bacterium]|nr:hypothetical protein [bacterium]